MTHQLSDMTRYEGKKPKMELNTPQECRECEKLILIKVDINPNRKQERLSDNCPYCGKEYTVEDMGKGIKITIKGADKNEN